MSQNPFETPAAHMYPDRTDLYTATDRFDLGLAISEGWEKVRDNLGVAVGGIVLYYLVAVVSAITIVIPPVLTYGAVHLMLNAYDDDADINDLFSGFSRFSDALVPFLVLWVILFGIGLPGTIMSFAGAYDERYSLLGTGLSYLYSLLISLLVTCRFAFAPYLIVEQELGAVDALRASWAMTRHQKLMTITMFIVAGLIGAVGVLACCVGMLFSLPVYYMIWTSAYRQMVPVPAPNDSSGSTLG